MPTHLDLHAGNILVGPDGELRLLDWEYATVADPLLELAVLLEHRTLPEAAVPGFVRHLLGPPAMPAPGELERARRGYRGLRLLWCLAVRELGGPVHDELEAAQAAFAAAR